MKNFILSKPTALIVDDDRAITKLVQTQLGFLGFEAATCDSVAQAKRFLTEHQRFEFILSDINMPGGSGVDLAEWVNNRYQRLPVFLMTAQPIDISSAGLHQSNVMDILMKPFQIRDLMAVLKAHLGFTITPPLYPSTQLQQPKYAANSGR